MVLSTIFPLLFFYFLFLFLLHTVLSFGKGKIKKKKTQKWTGSAFGITARVPRSAFRLTQGTPAEHCSDNGSGTKLHRQFCGTCGSGILEYGVL